MKTITIIIDVNDKYFNATKLIEEWHKSFGTTLDISDYLNEYIRIPPCEHLIKHKNQCIYIAIELEPQFRLHIANYDLDLYEKMNYDFIIWEFLPFPIPSQNINTADVNQCSTKTYIMIDELSGAIKIGHSRNPKFRERTLGAQIPKIKLLAICQEDIEKELHNKYKNKRIRGEWFNLSNTEVKNIMKHYKFIRL